MSAPSKAVKIATPGSDKFRRWGVLALAVVGALLFAASYFLPYWEFRLFAPQYPQGLELVISLDGVTGDTFEINTINHYIGMGHLDDAAKIERAFGGWLIGGLGLAVVVVLMFAGKNLGWLALLAGLGLPIGFLTDTFYWMYHFGHDLDPKAPIDLKPFTPTLFGEGKVGQFRTIATPGPGFWLAILAIALIGGAVWQRRKVCKTCAYADDCGTFCPHGLVAPPKS